MLILRSAPASPFGRKIKIAASLLGLSDRIDVQVADTIDPNDPIRTQNPLGKIPALILDDGTVLYDSQVILDFLDAQAGGNRLVPASGPERFRILTLAALADGIAEAALLLVYEVRFRDEAMRSARWMDHQQGKIDRGLAVLEASPPALASAPDIGAIATACALGYLDLRHHGAWRDGHPRLVAWLDDFAARVPAFAATKVVA